MTEVLNQILRDLSFVSIESTLILGSIVLLMSGLVKPQSWLIKSLFLLIVLGAFFFNTQQVEEGVVLSSSIASTGLAQQFGALFFLTSLLLLVFRRSKDHVTEFYFFILSILTGSLFLMKANSLLLVYLAIELTSYGSYILVNFSFKKRANEASIKYLLFGASSSAVMLLGLAILYGVMGSLYIHEWDVNMFDGWVPTIAFGLMLAGIFFKVSIFPFHIWVPAAYEQGPIDAIAFISIVPKLAALVLLKRLLVPFDVSHHIVSTCLLLGLLTMIFGTFGALRQTHVRRMISFGSVAHTGFLLPFTIISTSSVEASFWWYAVAYMVMNMAVFFFISFFERNDIFTLDEYGSLGSSLNVMAFSITMVVVSLVGLPPAAGFTAKFFLFATLWEQFINSEILIFAIYLAIAVAITVVSLFFYLRVPYYLYLVKRETSQSISTSFSTKFIATLFSIVLLLLFFVPKILMVMQQLLNNTAHE